jgi:hypothetical protein
MSVRLAELARRNRLVVNLTGLAPIVVGGVDLVPANEQVVVDPDPIQAFDFS